MQPYGILTTHRTRPTIAPGQEPRLLLVGGGGHAAGVVEAAQLGHLVVVGVLDDAPEPSVCEDPFNIPRTGAVDDLDRLGRLERDRPGGCDGWILGIGDVKLRRRVLGSVAEAAERGYTIIHPSAIVSPSATIGRGVFIGPGAIIHSRASVHDHTIINSGAVVEHDCVVGENSHVAPGAVVGGYVRIGCDTLVGLGSRVLPGVRIGNATVVGAGAVVRHQVSDGEIVVGVPAGPLTKV